MEDLCETSVIDCPGFRPRCWDEGPRFFLESPFLASMRFGKNRLHALLQSQASQSTASQAALVGAGTAHDPRQAE